MSQDSQTCPACNAPLIALNRSQRVCNSCGFDAVLVTPEDERERKNTPKPRAEVMGEQIGRYQQRW